MWEASENKEAYLDILVWLIFLRKDVDVMKPTSPSLQDHEKATIIWPLQLEQCTI